MLFNKKANKLYVRFCLSMMAFFNLNCVKAEDFPDPHSAADAFLSGLVSSNRAPGVQYVLVDREKTLYRFHAGLADLRTKKSVDDTTTFNGYSITKTFTAAAVVKLALEGKIDLDAPLKQYLKELPQAQSPTVRQTLQHVAGFPNPNPLPWVHRADRHTTFDEQAFVRRLIQEYPELDFKPGEKFSYSNIGYLLLGELVHRVSGMSFEQYVMTEIIQPLNLNKNQKISFTISDPDHHAYGYIRRWYWLNLFLGLFISREKFLSGSIDGWVPFNHLYVDGKAYGGLVGNAAGFARYLQVMLQRQKPFSQEMLDMMWTPGKTNAGEQTRSGLSWFYGELNGQRYFTHSGGAGGYYCEIRIYPDINLASVIMTNNTGISAQHYLDNIDRFFIAGEKSP